MGHTLLVDNEWWLRKQIPITLTYVENESISSITVIDLLFSQSSLQGSERGCCRHSSGVNCGIFCSWLQQNLVKLIELAMILAAAPSIHHLVMSLDWGFTCTTADCLLLGGEQENVYWTRRKRPLVTHSMLGSLCWNKLCHDTQNHKNISPLN